MGKAVIALALVLLAAGGYYAFTRFVGTQSFLPAAQKHASGTRTLYATFDPTSLVSTTNTPVVSGNTNTDSVCIAFYSGIITPPSTYNRNDTAVWHGCLRAGQKDAHGVWEWNAPVYGDPTRDPSFDSGMYTVAVFNGNDGKVLQSIRLKVL